MTGVWFLGVFGAFLPLEQALAWRKRGFGACVLVWGGLELGHEKKGQGEIGGVTVGVVFGGQVSGADAAAGSSWVGDPEGDGEEGELAAGAAGESCDGVSADEGEAGGGWRLGDQVRLPATPTACVILCSLCALCTLCITPR